MKKKIEEAMRQVQVEALRDQDFERISDGQRQRVMLARAICQEPEILVLDEPTSYLDIRYKTDFLWLLRSLARKRQMAVVMSLHEIDLAQKISDQVVCVKEHRVDRVGTPEEVMTTEYIQELYAMQDGVYDAAYGSVEFPKPTGGCPYLCDRWRWIRNPAIPETAAAGYPMCSGDFTCA